MKLSLAVLAVAGFAFASACTKTTSSSAAKSHESSKSIVGEQTQEKEFVVSAINKDNKSVGGYNDAEFVLRTNSQGAAGQLKVVLTESDGVKKVYEFHSLKCLASDESLETAKVFLCQTLIKRSRIYYNGGDLLMDVRFSLNREQGRAQLSIEAVDGSLPDVSYDLKGLEVKNSEPNPYRNPEKLSPN